MAGRSTESLDRIQMQVDQPLQVDDLFPHMDSSSAVYPTLRASADELFLAYYLPRHAHSAVVAFRAPREWTYGAPNDERLEDHRLWGRGLTFYNFHRVAETPGLARWIATFHEGTFEVVAESARVISRTADGSPAKALDELLGEGPNKVLDAV